MRWNSKEREELASDTGKLTWVCPVKAIERLERSSSHRGERGEKFEGQQLLQLPALVEVSTNFHTIGIAVANRLV